jgi:hypothetical protein
MGGWLDVQTTLVDDSTKNVMIVAGWIAFADLKQRKADSETLRKDVIAPSVNRHPLQHCFSSTLTIASPKSVFQPALGNESLPTTVHNDLLCLIRSAMYMREREERPLDDPRMQRATAGDRIDCGMGPTRLTNQWRAREWEGRVSPDSPPRPSYINDLAPHDILLPSSYLSPSASTHNKSPGHLHYNNSLLDTYL